MCDSAFLPPSLSASRPPSQLHPNAESLRFSGGANDTYVGGVSGMVIHDPDLNKIILAFAGTQMTDLMEWANNLNGELIDYPPCGGDGCQVHAGLYADYQVRDAMEGWFRYVAM